MTFLTVRSAADRLGVAYSTVKNWIYQGQLRTTRTEGGHHRVSEAEIQRFLSGDRRAVQDRSGARQPPTAAIVTLSARNQLRGPVEDVRRDGALGQIRLRIGNQTLTAVTTAEALGELKLQRGDNAIAIVKSTAVMITREIIDGTAPLKRRRSR